jgi:hypothetical protein
MRHLFKILACSLLLNTACIHPTPAPPPQPVLYSIGIVVQAPDQSRIPQALVQLHEADGYHNQSTDSTGFILFVVPASLVDSDVIISATGYNQFQAHVNVVNQQNYFYTLTPTPPPLPSPPTRLQALSLKLTFQGLTVATQQYGSLPWFEAALFSLTPADRQAVYAAKHAAGDTHALIAGMAQTGSVYDEPGQPYQQMNYAGLLNGDGSALVSAVVEVLKAGFWPEIILDADGAYVGCYTATIQSGCDTVWRSQFAKAEHVLSTSSYGDLTQYVVFNPGWDSVFYGYTPADITDMATYARSLCPQCYLMLEINTGHIPVGGGPADYAPGGAMTNWDGVLVEFNDTNIHDDSTWQVLGRLLGPAYSRPADQPSGDDPHPPNYAGPGVATPRGPYVIPCFEYGAYEWVRGIFTTLQIGIDRAYLQSLGCDVVD